MQRLYMETTQIPAEKTAAEICYVLVQSGATNINQQYEDKRLVGLRWTMLIAGQTIPFEMPVRVEPIHCTLEKRISPRMRYKADQTKLRQQAERVAWRQLLRWVQAQTAMIETGMVEAAEVFSPYMSFPQGTLYKCLQEGKLTRLLGAAS